MGVTDLETARRALFYRNGESFSRGKQMVVSDRKYPQLSSLKNALTRLLHSPISIERIWDIDRKQFVKDMQDILRNGHYICAGREKIDRQIDYTRVATPKWHRVRRADRTAARRRRSKTDPSLDETRRTLAAHRLQPLTLTPKANILVCHRNGCPATEKPRQYVVAAKSAATLDQVCNALTQQLGVVGGVRALFTLEAKRVKDVLDLYSIKHVIVCGPEKLDREFVQRHQAQIAGREAAGLSSQRRVHSGTSTAASTPHKNLRGDAVVPNVTTPTTPILNPPSESQLEHIPSTVCSAPDRLQHTPMQQNTSESTAVSLSNGALPHTTEQPEGGESEDTTELPSSSTFVEEVTETATDPTVAQAVVRAGVTVDYLVSQAGEVDQRTAVERQRQHAKAKAKMAQRLNHEATALERVELEHEQLDQAQAAERERQRQAFEAKLGKDENTSAPAETSTVAAISIPSQPGLSEAAIPEAAAVVRLQTPAVAVGSLSTTSSSLDLAVSPEELAALQTLAATRIQAAFRGHAARKHARAQAPARPEQRSLSAKSRKNEPDLASSFRPRLTRSETEIATALVGEETGLVPAEDVAALVMGQPSKLSFYGIVKESFVIKYLELFEKLGDGNFADVLQCRCKQTGKNYACKIIDKRNVPGNREKLMMIHEVKTMRTLSHAGCVKLYDVFETKGKIYLVTELMRDGDLFDYIVRNSKLTEPQAKPLVRDMLNALAHMHQRNIIHRDLKPENILLTKDKQGRTRLKLADFGLSMLVTEPLYAVCGTPTYVAPEIIDQDRTDGYGLPVDLWAVGVITYILLCGFPPFASSKKSQKDLFDKIRSGGYSFPKPYWNGINRSAKDFVTKLLQVNPVERLTAKAALGHAWLQAT